MKGEKIEEMLIAEEIQPFLLQLKDRFTCYLFENVSRLRSFFSIRLYNLFRQYCSIGDRVLDLRTLRKMFKIKEGQYSSYFMFKKRIILPAQRELKEKTDIYFDFEEIKEGRRIVAIRFFIHENVGVKNFEAPLEKEQEEALENLKKHFPDIAESTLKKLILSHETLKIKFATDESQKRSRDNKSGYFLKIIEDPEFNDRWLQTRDKNKQKQEALLAEIEVKR